MNYSMSDRKGTILVVGGTGGTGRAIIRRLLQQTPQPSIRILARNADFAKNILGDDVEICQGDVANPDLCKEAMIDVTRLIYCVGPHTFDELFKSTYSSLVRGLSNLLTEGKKHLLHQVVLISAAGTTRYLHYYHPFLNLFYGCVSLNHLRQEKILRDSGFDYIILRPYSLSDGDYPEPITVCQGDRFYRQTAVTRGAVAETILHAMYDGLVPSKVTFEIWGKDSEWSISDGFDWSVAFKGLRMDEERFTIRRYEFSHHLTRILTGIILVCLLIQFLIWFSS